MKNMKILKKSTAFLLTFVLLLTAATSTAFATTGPLTKEDELPMEGYISLSDYEGNGACFFDGETVNNTDLSGATYDLAQNTLTIDNVKLPKAELRLFCVGDDFKLKVKGTCELGCIFISDLGYGSSLCITGDGTLTVLGVPGEMSYGIFAYCSSVNQVQVDKSVTLHISSNREAIFAEEVSAENADTILMADGKPMPGVKKEERTYFEPICKNVIMDDSDDTNHYYYDLCLKRADDPNGYYAAVIWEEDGKEVYYIRHLLYLERYDAYIEDSSFGEYGSERVEKDELEESGYSYVIQPSRTDIKFFREVDIPYVGTYAYKLSCSDDPQGIYVGVPRYAGLHYNPAYDTVVGYEVHRVIKNENDGLYDDDPTFTPEQYDTEGLKTAGYEIVYQDEEENRTLRVWHTNHFDSDDNWITQLPVVMKEGSDDVYVKGAYFTSSWKDDDNKEHEEHGVYLYKVHHDEEENKDYINGEAESDGEDVIEVLDSQFTASGFYYVTEKKPLMLHFITADSFEDDPLHSYGYQATKDGDSTVYAVSEFWDSYEAQESGEDPDGYSVFSLQWNEERGIYVSKQASYLTPEEFKNEGYSYVITDQPIAFDYSSEVSTYELILAEDKEGKQYLLREYYSDMPSDVYTFNESNVLNVEGKQFYILSPADKLDVDPDTLTTVMNQDSTGTYNCYTEGNEYHHIGTGGGQTEVLIGDVNGDGVVNGADSGLLARYTAGWKGYESKIKNMAAADINRDGNINGADAGLVSRYTASWKGYDKYIKTVTV